MKLRNLQSFLFLNLVLLGCAKERPYEETFKEETAFSKSSAPAGNSTDFLYSVQSQGTPGFVSGAAPFMQGQEKIVRIRWNKDGIEVYRPYGSDDFDSETRTKKEKNRTDLDENIILSIPVDYISYHCKENADGQCTNEEEENEELKWDQKDQFIPKFEELELHDSNVGIARFDTDPCYSKVKTEVTHKEISQDVLNIELQHTFDYSDSEQCQESAFYRSGGTGEGFHEFYDQNSSFKTREFISIVKLENLVSKDYEPVEYPLFDQKIFGFFTTKDTVKNVDSTTYEKALLTRWQPNKTVTYQLSENFKKEENKYLLDATRNAFSRINEVLSQNNIHIKIALAEPSDAKSGDLRVSMINLIEELSSRILGYGPKVANPRTGEILAAHVNMYKGSLEAYAKNTYESMREFIIEKKKKESRVASEDQVKIDLSTILTTEEENSDKEEDQPSQIQDAISKSANIQIDEVIYNTAKKDFIYLDQSNNSNGQKSKFEQRIFKKLKLAKENEALPSQSKALITNSLRELDSIQSTLKELHSKNYYTTDLISIQELGKASLPEVMESVDQLLDSNGIPKKWHILTTKQQEKIRQIFVKNSYTTSLVHEIGHNLGLRHNFMGSADNLNFYHHYKDSKAPSFKNSSPNYSSIMDYGYSELNELSTFGYYDIAALRYGYNREVEIVSNPSVEVIDNEGRKDRYEGIKIKSLNNNGMKLSLRDFQYNPSSRLRTYKYCSDEDEGKNLECRKFDEGSNILEITKNYIERYQSGYKYSHIKNEFHNKNEGDHFRRLINLYERLGPLRAIHENWLSVYSNLSEVIDEDYVDYYMSFGEMDEKEQEGLELLIQANNLIGSFFLDIIKTPSLTCHFENVQIEVEGQKYEIKDFFLDVEEALENYGQVLSLPRERGYTVPTNCEDQDSQKLFKEAMAIKWCIADYKKNYPECVKAAKDQIALSATYKGQVGKIFNDIAEKQKRYERTEGGDLEVVGFWQDKIIASELLLSPFRLASGGGTNHYISYLDHHYLGQEIQNLAAHLAYGKELQNPQAFIKADGIAYWPSNYKHNLNNKIKLPTYGRQILSYFIDFSINETQDFSKTFLRLAAKVNYTEDTYDFADDHIFNALESHKFFGVYRWVDNKNETWYSPLPGSHKLAELTAFASQANDPKTNELNLKIAHQGVSIDQTTGLATNITLLLLNRKKTVDQLDSLFFPKEQEETSPPQDKPEEATKDPKEKTTFIAGLDSFVKTAIKNVARLGKPCECENTQKPSQATTTQQEAGQQAPAEEKPKEIPEPIKEAIRLAIDYKSRLNLHGSENSLFKDALKYFPKDNEMKRKYINFIIKNSGKTAFSQMLDLENEIDSLEFAQVLRLLMSYQTEDLEYYISTPEQKIVLDNKLREALLNLPSVGVK